jgi:multidrug resistance protein
MTPRALAVALVTSATFVDLVAYSICVPVLPDLAARYGASPTMIGLLFASFGVSLFAVSIPMGVASDRLGRKGPMVAGLIVLAVASAGFAFAPSLPWLFAARLAQGAADGVTWVVGFALIADLYGPNERGRVMGLVMSGTTSGVLVGPPLGGWLYDLGGVELPFLCAAAAAALVAIGFLTLRMPPRARPEAHARMRDLLRAPSIVTCIAVAIAGSGSYAMLEPVLALFFESRLGLNPTRIGLIFGIAAVASMTMHPVYGRLSDRFGGRPLMLAGLVVSAFVMPLMPFIWDMRSAGAAILLVWAGLGMIVTPSLAYLAEAAAAARVASYGIVYGFYNVAWAIGVMGGPALGGFLYERLGLLPVTLVWSVALVTTAAVLMRVPTGTGKGVSRAPLPSPQSAPTPRRSPASRRVAASA